MGKRLRSLPIQFDMHRDIQITSHAIRRFRFRVEGVPTHKVPGRIARMLRHTEQVVHTESRNGRIYLAHEKCVFVLSPGGVIVTVLPALEMNPKLAKPDQLRPRKKRRPKQTSTSRGRKRVLDRQRHRRERKDISHDECDDV